MAQIQQQVVNQQNTFVTINQIIVNPNIVVPHPQLILLAFKLEIVSYIGNRGWVFFMEHGAYPLELAKSINLLLDITFVGDFAVMDWHKIVEERFHKLKSVYFCLLII